MKLSAIVGLLLLASTASAQPDLHVADGHVCTLYIQDGVAVTGPPLPASAAETARHGQSYTRVVTRGRASTFEVDYSSGTPADAQAAFQKAVDIWSTHLTSTVPIRVEATFAELASNILGQASPLVTRPNGSSPWRAFALADAIAGRDLFPQSDNYDISATFNSAQSAFYYGLDGSPPSNQFDFVTIVLHELAHGLGFVGSGTVDDGAGTDECRGTANEGCIGIEFNGVSSPVIFDTFLEDGQGRSLLNTSVYPNNSAALADLLQSQDLFVDAPNVLRIFGAPAPIWAPLTFDSGSSFSHWDEILIRQTSAALMTPAVSRGEAYQDPGDITCAFMADMGWQLGAGCQSLTTAADDEPVAEQSLELVGPNPVADRTALLLRLPSPTAVRVTLVDALGRTVADVYSGVAADRDRVVVDVSGLSSGVYHIVADLDGSRVVRTVSVVR